MSFTACGIDFGTSNSTAVIHDGAIARLLPSLQDEDRAGGEPAQNGGGLRRRGRQRHSHQCGDVMDLPFSPLQAAGMALAIVIMGFLGGLVLSAVKRSLGAKDRGAMAKGLGGMMDRMDSVSFAAPIFFHLTRDCFMPRAEALFAVFREGAAGAAETGCEHLFARRVTAISCFSRICRP